VQKFLLLLTEYQTTLFAPLSLSVFKVIISSTICFFHSHALTSPLHLLTLYRAFVAACAAYNSLNLSVFHYRTLHKTINVCMYITLPVYTRGLITRQVINGKLQVRILVTTSPLQNNHGHIVHTLVTSSIILYKYKKQQQDVAYHIHNWC